MSHYQSPYVIEEVNGKEREYHITSRLLKDRIIMVSGVVDEDMAYILTAQLLHLAAQSDDDITMYINSPGGSVIDGLAIIDTMNLIKPDVSTVVTGMAASMGFAILSSGAKGKRFALQNSQIMCHQVSSGTRGHVEDMKISYEHSAYLNELLGKMIAKNIGMKYDTYMQKVHRDVWLTSEQAMSFGTKGVIDNILTKGE
jgi:ATP-dependent Clp protease protease subunit